MTTYKHHGVRLGPTSIAATTSNVVIGTHDLNGSDLLASGGGDALYLTRVIGLAYCASTTYPHSFEYVVCIEKRSSTYTVHHQTKLHDRVTGGLTVGPVTMNFAITSTSVFNVRMSNADSLTFSGIAYIYPFLWQI